jgi:CIC family chloride channel protein
MSGSSPKLIPLSELPRTFLAGVTRLRLAVLRHEELTGIVFWAASIGVLGALASVTFREAIRLFEFVLTGHSGSLVQVATLIPKWQRVLVPVIGGLLAGFTLHFGARALQSRRAVDYMEAIVVGNGVIGARATVIRSVASLLTIGSGGSIGREGPMVQLAALIGSKIGALVRAPVPRLRLMVACGAAAGIASAYNAPIAGAMFVAEIVMGSIAMESFGPLLVASVSANATIHNFLGYGPVFLTPAFEFKSNLELIAYAVLGVLLGHLAPPFLALLRWSRQQFARLAQPAYVLLPLGGLIVGLTSVFVPEVWGNGYSTVSEILNGGLGLELLVFILFAKVMSTAATVGSGAVGGVFTPTLFVGAAIGAIAGGGLHALLPHVASSGGAYALVGMGGFLAATTHAPLMSILMIFEMTLDYQVVLPLMLACVTAHYTAKVYRGGDSIYDEALRPGAARRTVAPVGTSADASTPGVATPGVAVTPDEEEWRLRTIGALIKPCPVVVRRDVTVRQVLSDLPKRPVQSIYVVNEDNELIASANPHKLFDALNAGRLDPSADIESAATAVAVSLRADMPLGGALDVFLQSDALSLPVTSGQWRAILIGQVSRSDLLLAVQDRISAPH